MSRKGPSTIGVAVFDPDKLVTDAETHKKARESLNKNDFQAAIKVAFSLPENDKYTYHATAAVTLSQAQEAIEAGPANGLCAWYPGDEVQRDENGNERRKLDYPTAPEVGAYISVFDPSKASANSLKNQKANAKKNSIQASVAENLTQKRYVDASINIPRLKKGHAHPNVYADFWAWSCVALKWAGPNALTAQTHLSHHILPVFMHHFGCVCPSYESLEIINAVSTGRKVLDVGSGNGYWTYMLRRMGVDVTAIDNGASTWRTLWIGDTVIDDGARYIKTRRKGGSNDVLLLVYPIVGDQFTVSVLNAYKGDVICVVGTQNGNGYTGFKDEMIDAWMARERRAFERVVQVPLPSFAGKDDALFVFRRREKKTNGRGGKAANGTEGGEQ